ncbi:putative prefoldin subunit 3 [Pavlovales sp. CCMP2436]|nr:putative prefoldin subunit 3 [Pavlovales sp. CCMP2436]|mmetsp:Transcript_32401/g.75655  ORF Transcript_32401/g.75655 Transcript_32401/m.75655 type:complete len:195 (+) Transcript_32401:37-621(+)
MAAATQPGQMIMFGENIPVMPFIDDIDAAMVKEGRSAETSIQKLQEQYNGYKMVEQQLTARKMKLRSKVPDIEKTLGVVKRMKASQEEGLSELKTHYELCDAVYAKAVVPIAEEQTVFLWLGANVMLEYTVEEAVLLLTTNLASAQRALVEVSEGLGFLKDQMTTCEVNMARVFNWDVRERRKAMAQEAEGGPK